MRTTAVAVALLLSAVTPVGAQSQPVTLDLSSTGTLTRSVDPGRVTFSITNKLPGQNYGVVIRREFVPIEAINVDAFGGLGILPPTERTTTCEALAGASSELNAATAESQVPTRRAVVVALLADGRCQDPKARAEAEAIIAATRFEDSIDIRSSEKVTVTVTRSLASGESKTWTLIFETEGRGEWITTFGFSFVFDHDRLFTTQPVDDGKFKIVEESNEWSLKKPMPSVYFSWMAAEKRRQNGTWSPTVGFGLDTTSASIFGGVSYTFNHNLSLIGGLAVTSMKQLNGRYTPDQVIAENLDEDQLHRTVYRPTAVVAVTLRFDRNPFTKEEAGAAPAVPAEPPAKKDDIAKPDPPANPIAAQPALTAPPAAPVTESLRDSDIKLRFDAAGTPREPAVITSLIARAKGATDIFVVSHGWWNDESAADCFYRRIVGGIEAAKPGYLTPDRFRPLFVTVYWPSAVFPMEPSDCTTAGRTESSVSTAQFSQDIVARWAASAFPEALRRPTFNSEASRLAVLLEKERTDALTVAESDELATVLVAWRSASGEAGGSGDGSEPSAFAGNGREVAQRWRDRPELRAELTIPGLNSRKWLNFGNAFTFWSMKERAGIVGSKGLGQVLRALQPLRQSGLRIHLVGHSFGGKLVTASLTGHGAPANRVDSLVILQGAFSQFAFASRDEIRQAGITVDRDGLYRDVVASGLVAGPVVVTFSSADVPNRVLYPAGVALVNDVTEASRAPRYGSLGAQGIRGSSSTLLNLSLQPLDSLTVMPKAISVDGSNVILGHSDLVKPQVFRLIWNVVEVGR